MSETPTPRTDAELVSDPFHEWVMSSFARTLERELSAADERTKKAEAERDALRSRLIVAEEAAERCKAVCDMTSEGWRAECEALRADHGNACKLVADMHAAATGRPGEGPRLGVVEDVAAVHAECDRLQAENERLRIERDALRSLDDSLLTEFNKLRAECDALRAALSAMLEQFNYNTITGIVHDESAAIANARAALKEAKE